MDQLLQQQHAQDGTGNFDEEELKKTLGGILSFIKSKLGSVDFEKIQSAIPESSDLISKAESENASKSEGGSNNLLSSAMSMLGQKTGGDSSTDAASSGSAPIDSMTQLLGYMGKMGVDPKQAMAFLPVVANFLKDNAGIDVSSALGTPAAATGEAAEGTDQTEGSTSNTASNDMVGNLMNQASGFMNSFTKK